MPEIVRPASLATSRSPVLGHLWRSISMESSQSPVIPPPTGTQGPSPRSAGPVLKSEEV
jgi:hypothetical protein